MSSRLIEKLNTFTDEIEETVLGTDDQIVWDLELTMSKYGLDFDAYSMELEPYYYLSHGLYDG